MQTLFFFFLFLTNQDLLPGFLACQYKKFHCGLRTADYGLGIRNVLAYKAWTTDCGLGIKYGQGNKTRTENRGLRIKRGLTGCKITRTEAVNIKY